MKKIRIAQIGTSVNSHGNFVFDSLRKAYDIFENKLDGVIKIAITNE